MSPDGQNVQRLWDVVIERWDDPRAHQDFIQACFDRSLLGEAAALYRSVKDDPERGPEAVKRLQAVAVLAVHVLDAQRSEPKQKLPRWLLIVAASICASAVASLVYWLAT